MGEIVQEMYFVLLLLQDYLSELQKERGDKTRWKSFIHVCIFEPYNPAGIFFLMSQECEINMALLVHTSQ